MIIRRRGRACALAVLVLAVGCSAPASPPASAPPDESRTGTVKGRGSAVATVPEIVAPATQGPASSIRPASYAYVSDTNRLLFFDKDRRQLAPDVELAAVPQEIAAAEGRLILAFPTGDLALIDVVTRRQTARASLAALRARALGGDLILDEALFVADEVLLVAGRIADKATGSYRSFVQERSARDLSLLREQVLPHSLGVVQDVAVQQADAVRLLLSDGSIYDPRAGKIVEGGGDEDSQVLRYGPAGERWIGSGDGRPGLLTPDNEFVPLAAGRVTDVVPLSSQLAAVLVSQPPQVWLVSSSGDVTTKVDVDDYPYAGALVGDKVYVGSTNGDALQVLNLASGAVEQRLVLGVGIVRLGALRAG